MFLCDSNTVQGDQDEDQPKTSSGKYVDEDVVKCSFLFRDEVLKGIKRDIRVTTLGSRNSRR